MARRRGQNIANSFNQGFWGALQVAEGRKDRALRERGMDFEEKVYNDRRKDAESTRLEAEAVSDNERINAQFQEPLKENYARQNEHSMARIKGPAPSAQEISESQARYRPVGMDFGDPLKSYGMNASLRIADKMMGGEPGNRRLDARGKTEGFYGGDAFTRAGKLYGKKQPVTADNSAETEDFQQLPSAPSSTPLVGPDASDPEIELLAKHFEKKKGVEQKTESMFNSGISIDEEVGASEEPAEVMVPGEVAGDTTTVTADRSSNYEPDIEKYFRMSPDQLQRVIETNNAMFGAQERRMLESMKGDLQAKGYSMNPATVAYLSEMFRHQLNMAGEKGEPSTNELRFGEDRADLSGSMRDDYRKAEALSDFARKGAGGGVNRQAQELGRELGGILLADTLKKATPQQLARRDEILAGKHGPFDPNAASNVLYRTQKQDSARVNIGLKENLGDINSDIDRLAKTADAEKERIMRNARDAVEAARRADMETGFADPARMDAKAAEIMAEAEKKIQQVDQNLEKQISEKRAGKKAVVQSPELDPAITNDPVYMSLSADMKKVYAARLSKLMNEGAQIEDARRQAKAAVERIQQGNKQPASPPLPGFAPLDPRDFE